MSGLFGLVGCVDGIGEEDGSIHVDVEIDEKCLVILSTLKDRIELTIAQTSKLSCLLRDAARHAATIERNRKRS